MPEQQEILRQQTQGVRGSRTSHKTQVHLADQKVSQKCHRISPGSAWEPSPCTMILAVAWMEPSELLALQLYCPWSEKVTF